MGTPAAPHASVFLNLGDTYRDTFLTGIPARFEVAAREAGWRIANHIRRRVRLRRRRSYCGVNFDHCLDPETGGFSDEEAAARVRRLSTYAEVSPSGDGVHLLMRGVLPRCAK